MGQASPFRADGRQIVVAGRFVQMVGSRDGRRRVRSTSFQRRSHERQDNVPRSCYYCAMMEGIKFCKGTITLYPITVIRAEFHPRGSRKRNGLMPEPLELYAYDELDLVLDEGGPVDPIRGEDARNLATALEDAKDRGQTKVTVFRHPVVK